MALTDLTVLFSRLNFWELFSKLILGYFFQRRAWQTINDMNIPHYFEIR
jgi:hypothetical protein